MRRLCLVTVLLVLALTIVPLRLLASPQGDPPRIHAADSAAAFVSGELLVRFRSEIMAQTAQEIVAAENAAIARRIPSLGVDVLRLPPGLSVQQALERFGRYPEVEYAEPNYILQALEVDDPGLSNQWAPQKIEAPAAWAITTGDPAVTIAVVDTGIDYRHSELAPNMWVNADEVASNGLDDDGNGYVDDVKGWDFVNGDADPLDDEGHGTHVAGIAAAVDNENPAGLVGICPSCTLMPVKVLDIEGSGPVDAVVNGMMYAADNGARVINLSLGATVGSATLEQAVNYVWGRDAVLAAAAGNGGSDTRLYPAAYANAMAVASTGASDQRSGFSNYGSGYINVAAPGEWIYSTVLLDKLGNDAYETHSGTSMSTPHVCGLAGLLFSQVPTRTNTIVRDLIETTAEDLGPAGTDAYFGSGRINAGRAVAGGTTPNSPPTNGTVMPNTGGSPAGQIVYFTTTHYDTDGYGDIKACRLHVGRDSAPKSLRWNAVFNYHVRSNKIRIRNNKGTKWWGGKPVGSNNVVQNAQAAVHCNLTTVTKTGNMIEVRWAVEFKPSFTGDKRLYLKTTDWSGATTRLQREGTWTVY